MAKKRNDGYTDAPAGVEKALSRAVRIKDFLPSPEELLGEDNKTKKITLYVSDRSLNIFKKYAKTHNGKYQIMIRKLIDAYAENILTGK